jgi:hypothetical protein
MQRVCLEKLNAYNSSVQSPNSPTGDKKLLNYKEWLKDRENSMKEPLGIKDGEHPLVIAQKML